MIDCENRDFSEQSKIIIDKSIKDIFRELKIKPSKYCVIELHIKMDDGHICERIDSAVRTIHKKIHSTS